MCGSVCYEYIITNNNSVLVANLTFSGDIVVYTLWEQQLTGRLNFFFVVCKRKTLGLCEKKEMSLGLERLETSIVMVHDTDELESGLASLCNSIFSYLHILWPLKQLFYVFYTVTKLYILTFK